MSLPFFIPLAFLLAGVALQDVVVCSLRSQPIFLLPARMSAGADPRASCIERDGLSTRHSPAPLSLWSNHRPGLHRDHRGLGLHHWDGRATSGHRFDGRLGLETVDAAEGVENTCWYTSRVHEGVQRACACVMRHKSKLLTHARTRNKEEGSGDAKDEDNDSL